MFPLRTLSVALLTSLALTSVSSAFSQAGQPRQAPTVDAALPEWTRTLEMRFDPRGGQLVRLAGAVSVVDGIVDAGSAGEVALRIAEQLGAALATQATSWHVVAARRVSSLYKVELEQRLFGRRVVDARVDLRLDEQGNLHTLTATGLAQEETPANFPIRAAEAAELARRAPAQLALVELGPGTYAYAPEEVFVNVAGAMLAAWQCTVIDPGSEFAGAGSWRVLIDAASGRILSAASQVTHSVNGTTTGRWIASGSQSDGGPPVEKVMTNLHVTGFDVDDALFRITDNDCFDGNSRISKDGERIVWTSRCDGDEEIWTSLIDGTGALKLTDNLVSDRQPVLSEDGMTIVFTSNRDGNDELYAIQSDGTGLVRLTTDPGADREASLNKAGTLVAFTSNRSGNDDIWRVSTTGTGLTQVTTDLGRDYAGVLSGDGSTIGFLSNRDGDVELFVHKIFGALTTQITFDDVAQRRPSIDDSGSLLAFTSLAPSPDAGVAVGTPTLPVALGRPRNGGVRSLARPWQVWLAAADGSFVEPLTSGAHGSLAPALAGNGLAVAYLERNKFGSPTLVVEDLADGSLFSMGEVHPATRPDLAEDALRGTFVRSIVSPEVFTWDFTVGTSLKTTTSLTGLWLLPFEDGTSPSVSARLRGLWARVKDLASGSRDLRMNLDPIAPSVGNDHVFNPTGAAENKTAQVTAYQHTTEAHNSLSGVMISPKLALPVPLAIDEQLRVEVNAAGGVHNAFYDGERETTRFFASAGPTAPNTAIDTVLHHEYGHFADDMYGGHFRVFPGEHPFGVSEAFADAVAIYNKGTLLLGAGWDGPGTWLRHYGLPLFLGGSSDRTYDCLGCGVDPNYPGVPEPHQHGEALAGFFADLGFLAPMDAGELVFGSLALDPISMPASVEDIFILGGTPSFCAPCGGDVAKGPLYDPICRAAAAHGFECAERVDLGSKGCFESFCTTPAGCRSTGTEWLGATVDGNDVAPCMPMDMDDDGVVILTPPISGMPMEIAVTITAADFLLGSGRYALDPMGEYLPSRVLFLNVWLYIEVMTGVWAPMHVLGSGSGTMATGNVPIGGPDTLAYDPDLFGGMGTETFMLSFMLPDVAGFTAAALRVRLDYGEDGGAIPHAGATGTYAGPCGVARFGEVEDYGFGIAPF